MYENLIIGILTLFTGWVLGIASNVILEKQKRKSTKKDIVKGICTELSELQIHLASVSIISMCNINKFDKTFFLWAKPFYLKSLQSAQSIFSQEQRDLLPNINELDDDTLFNLIKLAHIPKQSKTQKKSFTYQNITTPFIDSKIDEIHLLNIEIQKLIFTLVRDINFLNNDISQVWFYHSKTFDDPTPNNFEKLQFNLQSLYSRIGSRTKVVVDNISTILEEINKK